MIGKQKIKQVLRKAPWLGIAAVKAVRPVQFYKEKQAYNGGSQEAKNQQPSLVYFSHYRCASMMVNRRLLDLLAGKNYRQLDYQGYVHPWSIERREAFQGDSEAHEQFKRFPQRGHYFGPLRYFVDIPHLDKLKPITVLRDPRDVLVSRYYSEKYNHVRLDTRFLRHCESIASLSLDEFVLAFKEDVGSHYNLYLKNKAALESGLMFPYEELIKDFRGFLGAVNDFVGLERSASFLDAVASQESFVVDKENRFSHKRSVEARNFEKKLKPETIEELNQFFSEMLLAFDWEI